MSQIINSRYHLHTLLGEGGMGTVYLATDRLSHTQVACKQVLLDPEHAFDDSKTQTVHNLRLALAQEFQFLAGLRHPHIVSVLDYGFDEEAQPFFTMSYLPNAQNILEAGKKQPLDHKLALIQQLLQALAYLHRHGILHHDIKPANVLVSEGTLRVLDFGLATKTLSESGSFGGTASYTPPEVWQGQPYTIAADLYAVGVIAYELLVGEHPYGPFDNAYFDRIINAEPDLEKLGLNGPATQIIGRLLAKKPAGRYPSANATLNALSDALDNPITSETVAIRESYLQAAPFVGRDSEIAQLTEALKQAQSGPAAVWLIGGESGVGKSRLLDELRSQALVSGWQVLSGQAIAEGGVPYQLWHEIVRRLALTSELSELEASILKEISPNLDHLLGKDIPAAPDMARPAKEQRLTQTFIEALKRQIQPTLLMLEDLHWAGSSLKLLKQLLTESQHLPGLMVIGTYRDDETSTLPDDLPGSQTLTLGRLEKEAVAKISRAMVGEAASTPEIVDLLTRETEGNTFFMVEVMRALAEEAGQLSGVGQITLPREVMTNGMAALLQRRIQKLPDEDQPLLKLAAVAGRELDEKLLELLLPGVDVVGWLQRAADAAIIMIREEQWLFNHDKLRQGILTELTDTQHREAHRQVAIAIEQLYPNDDRYNAVLLDHWREAGDEEKESQYLLPVARYLIKMAAASDQGRELLNRGLTLFTELDEQRVELLSLRTESYLQQGNLKEAEGVAQEAFEAAQELANQSCLADSLLHLGNVSLFKGDYAKAQNNLQRCLSIRQSLEDHRGIANVQNNLGFIAFRRNDFEASGNYFQQSLDIWNKMADQFGIAAALNNLGLVTYRAGKYATARQYFQQSLEIKQAIGNQWGIATTLNNLGRLAYYQGDHETARDYYQQTQAIEEAIGNQRASAIVIQNLGALAFAEGNYEQAITLQQEALRLLTVTKAPSETGPSYGIIARSQVALKDYEAALATALAHYQLQEELEVEHARDLMLLAMAELLVATQSDKAWQQEKMGVITSSTQIEASPIAYFEAALDATTSIYDRLQTLLAYSQYLAESGQVEETQTHLAEATEIAGESQLQYSLDQIETLKRVWV